MKNFLVFCLMLFSIPAFAQAVSPSTPAPSAMPTLPGDVPPPPTQATGQEQAQQVPSASNVLVDQPSQGQYIYTSQYGWIWAPYAQQYTYVDSSGELAFVYAWRPTYGWAWFPAPWVLGFGPVPYWGLYGPRHYVWFAHPWYRPGLYRPNVWQRYNGVYGGRPNGLAHPYAPHYGGGYYRGGGHGHR